MKILLSLIFFSFYSFKANAATTIKEVVELCENDKASCTILLSGFFEGASAASLSLLDKSSETKLDYCHENMAKDKHSTKQEMVFWYLEQVKAKANHKQYSDFLELPFGMFYYTWFLPAKYPLDKNCSKA